MRNSVSRTILTHRRFTQISGMTVASLALPGSIRVADTADVTLEIAPYSAYVLIRQNSYRLIMAALLRICLKHVLNNQPAVRGTFL